MITINLSISQYEFGQPLNLKPGLTQPLIKGAKSLLLKMWYQYMSSTLIIIKCWYPPLHLCALYIYIPRLSYYNHPIQLKSKIGNRFLDTHCGQVGPHLRDRVPMGTFFSFWVPNGDSPFFFKVPIFFISCLRTREKSMQPLSNVGNLITCDNTTTTNESHASLSVKSVQQFFPPFKGFISTN